MPQPYYLRKLCELYGVSAGELGFEAMEVEEQTTSNEEGQEALNAFRKAYLPARLLHMVCTCRSARYHELQGLLSLELEDNIMDDSMSRRDALRFLALLPLEMSGLSKTRVVSHRPYDEILAQCAAGITACWYLRKGKELNFAADAVSAYLPTLQAMTQTAQSTQRKTAADLVVQCLLLQATLALAVATPTDAINYARRAESYSSVAESRILQVVALRTKATALSYANQWQQALQEAEKARYLVEQKPSQRTDAPLPPIVHSYIYAGLASFQSYHGQKEDALCSLKRAHTAFFAQPMDTAIPIWIDHNIGNLLRCEGEAYMYLGIHKKAIDTLTQIETRFQQDASVSLTCRANAYTNQVIAEVNRDDQSRDMDWCIDRWQKAITDAKVLQSNLRLNEATQAYAIMRAAWPAEHRIKELRAHLPH